MQGVSGFFFSLGACILFLLAGYVLGWQDCERKHEHCPCPQTKCAEQCVKDCMCRDGTPSAAKDCCKECIKECVK